MSANLLHFDSTRPSFSIDMPGDRKMPNLYQIGKIIISVITELHSYLINLPHCTTSSNSKMLLWIFSLCVKPSHGSAVIDHNDKMHQEQISTIMWDFYFIAVFLLHRCLASMTSHRYLIIQLHRLIKRCQHLALSECITLADTIRHGIVAIVVVVVVADNVRRVIHQTAL